MRRDTARNMINVTSLICNSQCTHKAGLIDLHDAYTISGFRAKVFVQIISFARAVIVSRPSERNDPDLFKKLGATLLIVLASTTLRIWLVKFRQQRLLPGIRRGEDGNGTALEGGT